MASRSKPGARAALIEIFDSIQGEGRHVGVPMAFVRVATCPLRCSYCDTPHSYVAGPQFTVAARDGVRSVQNPVSAAVAAEGVLATLTSSRRPHPVSATGGEPLVYPEFLRDLGDALGPAHPLHLETAALDARALRTVLPVLRHLSADYKLPETIGGVDRRADHVACVEAALARGGVSIDVKVVLTPGVATASLVAALAALTPFRAGILLVLQPVTPFGAERAPLPPTRLAEFARIALDAGFDVRVLPQVHKVLAVP